VSARDLESALPSLKFAALLICALVRDFLVEREIEVKVNAPGDFLPHTCPCRVIGTSASVCRAMSTPARLSPKRGCHTRQVSVSFEVDQAGLAIPDIGRVIEASTEDVNGAVAAIAPHGTMAVTERSTDKTRFPSLHGE
jgi:hypothetical protein